MLFPTEVDMYLLPVFNSLEYISRNGIAGCLFLFSSFLDCQILGHRGFILFTNISLVPKATDLVLVCLGMWGSSGHGLSVIKLGKTLANLDKLVTLPMSSALCDMDQLLNNYLLERKTPAIYFTFTQSRHVLAYWDYYGVFVLFRFVFNPGGYL